MDEDDYDAVRQPATVSIGLVKEFSSKESAGLRTTIRVHEKGLSITHYRRHFQHYCGKEVPGTSEWVVVRHQEYMTVKVSDMLDGRYDIKPPTQPIPGDPDD